jgi:hypothetical protein
MDLASMNDPMSRIDVPSPFQHHQPLTIEVPVFVSQHVEASTRLPLGGTLLVSGLRTDDPDHFILTFIRADLAGNDLARMD